MPVPQSTSSPRSGSPASRPTVESPSSSRAYGSDVEEQRRIAGVQRQLDTQRDQYAEFGGDMNKGRDGDRERENTYDSYFPAVGEPSDGGFASMLQAGGGPDSDDEDDDFRPKNVNPQTGMRLPTPSGQAGIKAPPPIYAAAGGSVPGSPRERVDSSATQYTPMSERERRSSLRAQAQSSQQQQLVQNPFATPPNQQLQARGQPQLAIQTQDLARPAPAFASPFSAAPPSPALAWAPDEKKMYGDDRRAKLEEKVLIRGRDRGEDRSSKFWNRFSVVVHANERAKPQDKAYLKKESSRTARFKMIGWISGIFIILCIAAALVAYFLLRDKNAAPDTGNRSGIFQATSTNDDAINAPAVTTAPVKSTSVARSSSSVARAASTNAVKRQVFNDPDALHIFWGPDLAHLTDPNAAEGLHARIVASTSEDDGKRRLARDIDELE